MSPQSKVPPPLQPIPLGTFKLPTPLKRDKESLLFCGTLNMLKDTAQSGAVFRSQRNNRIHFFNLVKKGLCTGNLPVISPSAEPNLYEQMKEHPHDDLNPPVSNWEN